jgi:outer membrane receptor protein involved in Fe transport
MLRWETATQSDAGMDISIFQDKLSLSVDYFDKVNSNMLVEVPLPMIGGSASAPNVNDGSVQNKGFEFDLQYKRDHQLKYSFSANLATIQNKVLSIPVPIQGGRIDNGLCNADHRRTPDRFFLRISNGRHLSKSGRHFHLRLSGTRSKTGGCKI